MASRLHAESSASIRSFSRLSFGGTLLSGSGIRMLVAETTSGGSGFALEDRSPQAERFTSLDVASPSMLVRSELTERLGWMIEHTNYGSE